MTRRVFFDSVSDRLLAEQWLDGSALANLPLERLPDLSNTPDFLRPLVSWERLDWVITSGERIGCVVEFSRHGYTGDNSFQRFARIYRAATLGIPIIYFTPFSRARLNELDEGRRNPRNVAPELFRTMEGLSTRYGVPCLVIDWPVGLGGTPLPLSAPEVAGARDQLVSLLEFLVAERHPGSNQDLRDKFSDVVESMRVHAELPFRGSSTRGLVRLPQDIEGSQWLRSWLPTDYFSSGKVDKVLASLVLEMIPERRIIMERAREPFWRRRGQAQVLFLGYQWRPDPSCGLIALSAAKAEVEEVPLIVAWPRVFTTLGGEAEAIRRALSDFREAGRGPLMDEANRLGFEDAAIASFRRRVSIDPNQFGVFSPGSKIDRVLRDTGAIAFFADAVLVR